MNSEGRVVVRVNAAEEAIPVEDATIVVTRRVNGGRTELLGLRTTDENGQITPVVVETPDKALSETATGEISWSTVDVTAEHPGYGRVIVENVQVFPGVTSIQEIALIPLEENPPQWSKTEIFDVTPQEL